MKVTVYNSFHEIPEHVKTRISYPEQTDFFNTLNWFEILYTSVLQQTTDLLIYTAYDSNDNPLGLLFCCTQHHSRRLASLSNYYSLEYSPVFLADKTADRESISKSLIEYIANEVPKWKSIDFRLLPSHKKDTNNLINFLREVGYRANNFFQYDNWYYTLRDESFSTYYDARPSRLRNTIKRKSNSLKKKHSIDIRVYRYNDTGLLDGINDYVQVYNSSWKKPEPFTDFIPSLIKSCATLGILRLGILYLDHIPVAAQIWITTKHKAIIYKLAYDESYKKESVGSILSKELFEIAIDEDRVNEIDYGVGSEPYKQEWMQSVRQINGIEAINRWSLEGLWWLGKAMLKPISKRFLTNTSN